MLGSFLILLLVSQIARADPSVNAVGASCLLKEWYTADIGAANGRDGGEGPDWENDKKVLGWVENKVNNVMVLRQCKVHRSYHKW